MSEKDNLFNLSIRKGEQMLSDEELKIRREHTQQEALESVAAKGEFIFRLDVEAIKKLYEIAGKRHRHVEVMVREWVLERLKEEDDNN